MNALRRLALTGVLLALSSASAGVAAQDLLGAWRAAAERDHRLAVARAEHGASQALREQADALWRPQVGLTLGVGAGTSETAMRGARFAAPGMGQVDEARFATSVAPGAVTRLAVIAQQPLINAGRQAQQAQLQVAADMGDIAWHAAQTELMLVTAERYFALAVAEERVRVTARQAASVARARAQAHDRYQIGSSPVTDTHEADAALAGVQAREAAAAFEASVRRQQLAGSTGIMHPSAQLPARELMPVEGLDIWAQRSQDANPRLRLLTQAVTVAEHKLRQHGVAGRATLDLVAQAGHDRIAGSGDFGSARNRELNGMVGVQLTIPLSTGGMREAQEREAARRLDKARAELDLAREEVGQQVRAAWLGLQTGGTRIAALAEGLKAGWARLDATRLGHEVGDRTLLDVLNAQSDHAEAELALAQARSEQLLTYLRLAALADRLDETLLAQVNATLAPANPAGGGR